MCSKIFISIFFFSELLAGLHATPILVNTSYGLEDLLHSPQMTQNISISIVLDSRITHNITSTGFYSITSHVTIASSTDRNATISCLTNTTRRDGARGGLMFIDNSVTLRGLVFEECGASLATVPPHIVDSTGFNSSSLHYTTDHAAVLFYIGSSVNMTDVYMVSSYGFAILAIDVVDSLFRNITAINSTHAIEIRSQNNSVNIGSGVMIHFMDTNAKNHSESGTLLFQDIHVLYNWDLAEICQTIPHSNTNVSVVNAAGLTIIYAQNNYNVSVNISNSTFDTNVGCIGGGLLVLSYSNGATTINNTVFHKNFNYHPYHGAALSFYWINYNQSQSDFGELLIVKNCQFIKHNGLDIEHYFHDTVHLTGAIYINIHRPQIIQFTFTNTSFYQNIAATDGACLLAEVHQQNQKIIHNVSIVLNGITAKENSQLNIVKRHISTAGMFSFYRITQVNIMGTQGLKTNFTENYGSVIRSVGSEVHLNGHIDFISNQGMYGAAIYHEGTQPLHLHRDLVASFTGNVAMRKGGAIYAKGLSDYLGIDPPQCTIALDELDTQPNISDNVAIEAGNVIFAYPITNCRSTSQRKEIAEKLRCSFNQSKLQANNLLSVSTMPSNITGFEKSCQDISYNLYRYRTYYPGETKEIYLAAVDGLGKKVYTELEISVLDFNKNRDIKVSIQPSELRQILNEGQCTLVNLTLGVNYNNITDPIPAFVVLIPEGSNIHYHNITILPCPPGFRLNGKTKKCECSPILMQYHKCFIQTQRISQTNTLLWMGVVPVKDNSTYRFATGRCPIRYCNYEISTYKWFQYNKNSSDTYSLVDNQNRTIPLCRSHREGTLCGRCGENLSVVFGSYDCMPCSNDWLWTIPAYIALGPLLVCILYVLRLTLTAGTLNGIILFAQFANCGPLDLLHFSNNSPYYKLLTESASVFLSLLNLNLGFPLCFYNGMNELQKAGLCLLFPVYLLVILISLVILSRYSTWISNKTSHSSVQVFVTVLHLSFSKLLIAAIDVFTATTVHVEAERDKVSVWFWDGMVSYGDPWHIVLMAATVLVVVPLILPYILILLFTKPLRKSPTISKYLRPMIEAVHAPYKERQEYWFVAQLILLVYATIVFAILRAISISMIYFLIYPVLLVFTVAKVYCRPYKSDLLNIMDCVIHALLLLISTVTWYWNQSSTPWVTSVIVACAVSIVFVLFVTVLMYHILKISRYSYLLERILHYLTVSPRRIRRHRRCTPTKVTTTRLSLNESNSSYYGSCSSYREPVLSTESQA